jgi:hypothetical protein
MTPEQEKIAEHLNREPRPEDVVSIEGDRVPHLFYLCPGCDAAHSIPIFGSKGANGAGPWQWNESYDAPTITPSVNAGGSDGYRCHHTITDGKMFVYPDSSKRGGETLDMERMNPDS